MKPTELRSGNYVNVPHGDVQIDHFIKDGCHFTDGCGGTFASLHPIPLTEEWRKKFKLPEWLGIEFHTSSINPDYFMISFGYKHPDGGYMWTLLPKEYRYVHELQNLYFCLTDKELEIK